GLDDAIKDVFKTPDGVNPYDLLSRSGQRFVDQVAAQKRALVGLRQLAQDRVLDGLDRELALLAGETLPFARQQVVRFGDTWNDTLTEAMRLGRNPEFLSGLDAAFAASDR